MPLSAPLSSTRSVQSLHSVSTGRTEGGRVRWRLSSHLVGTQSQPWKEERGKDGHKEALQGGVASGAGGEERRGLSWSPMDEGCKGHRDGDGREMDFVGNGEYRERADIERGWPERAW